MTSPASFLHLVLVSLRFHQWMLGGSLWLGTATLGCGSSLVGSPMHVSARDSSLVAPAIPTLHENTESSLPAEAAPASSELHLEAAAPVKHSPPTLPELARRRAWEPLALRLPEVERSSLATQYLGARVAFELGYYDVAVDRYRSLLSVDELSQLVRPGLDRALVRARRLDELPQRSRSRVEPDDLLYAAEQYLQEKRLDDAGSVLTLAGRRIRGSGEDAVRLRQLRARWGFEKGLRFRAFVDWRWLAEHAPASAASAEALLHLQKEFPHHQLAGDDWRRRVESLASRGRAEALPREFEGWRTANGRKPGPGLEAHFLGWAHYKARDYERAAPSLLDSALQGGEFARHDRYYAARSLSRLGRHDAAIEQYRTLLAKSRKGRTGHNAAFRLAREHSLVGDWAEAIEQYTGFLSAHRGSDLAETALRERAVARYALGAFERAADEFKALRYSRPRSSFAGLYKHLEGLSLVGKGDVGAAVQLLQAVVDERPFSFEGWAARQRLTALGQPVTELVPPKEELRPGTKVDLPKTVSDFERHGLFEEAEALLISAEHEVANTGTPGERFEPECRAHEQLFAGRRRLLLGLSAARQHGLFSAPSTAPRWVWQCLHPEPYSTWVNGASLEFDVPRSLVYAVMRQESGFRPSVVSPADAHGLMQIIPKTAREIAIALGDLVPEQDASQLDFVNPHVNVRYGGYYLGRLLREFNEHPALAAAGYNAGPDAARLWLNAGSQLPLELFIARIPFDETRRYVMNVLLNLNVYAALDGRETVAVPLAFVDSSPTSRE